MRTKHAHFPHANILPGAATADITGLMAVISGHTLGGGDAPWCRLRDKRRVDDSTWPVFLNGSQTQQQHEYSRNIDDHTYRTVHGI
jgi:hypothetical protein